MSETKDKKQVMTASQKAIAAIVAQGNIAFSGEGTALWIINSDEKYEFDCIVHASKNDTYYLQPDMTGILDAEGNQLKPFRLFAGSFYSELDTFEEGELVSVAVVQRVPNPDVTDADLERIDAWAKEQNEAEGRTMQGRASDAFREAKRKELVTYMVTGIDEK